MKDLYRFWDIIHFADRDIWHLKKIYISTIYMCALTHNFLVHHFSYKKVIEFYLDLHYVVPMTKLAFDKR